MKLKFIIGVVGILSACGFTNAPSLDTTQEEQDNNWVIGPFHRPEGVNPVISPAADRILLSDAETASEVGRK